MQKNPNKRRMYYFSDRLKKQLSQIPHHPLTIVEAPPGFGKTTAIKEYLKENLPPGAGAYWYTCLGEPASMAWKSICALLANVNAEIANTLRQLEMPTTDMLFCLMAYLKDFHCQKETYLVIDNYQLVNCDIPRELMSVFSMHGDPNLHMIFITQQLGVKQQFSIHNAGIHTIGASAFFFNREGISSLLRMEGIRLADNELENVFISTDGWISAIRLQIINFQETGSFDYTPDIEHLVENAIWKRLSPDEKEFLLSVSVLDSFDVRQAAFMIDKEILPDDIEYLIKSNEFIRYFPEKKVYVMHSILRGYLQNRFYHHQSEEFQKLILHRAGESCVALSQFSTAARFFFKVRDFDSIMSMPFNLKDEVDSNEYDLMKFVAVVVNECPEDTLCKYPLILLISAHLMLLSGQHEIFQKIYRLIISVIEKNIYHISPNELRRIKGEVEILNVVMAFNDIKKINEHVKAAWEIMEEPSIIITNNMSWTFGCASALFLYWRESGNLEDDLPNIDSFVYNYCKLTQGQGTGADSLIRAEAMLMRGEDGQAEILCHKAVYDARNRRQTSICICAELVLARIAILRGNVDGYFAAITNIQGYAKENAGLYILRMADLAMSTLSLILGTSDNVATWLFDMQSIRRTLYAPTVPYAQTLHSMLLLLEKRYNEFLGISQQIIDTAKSMHYLMPQVYQLKYMATVKFINGNEQEAMQYLKEALAIAIPDKIYLPFAQQMNSLDILLKPAMSAAFDKKDLNAVMALSKRQGKGVNIIKKAIQQVKSPLTSREREIVLLAKDRLSAKEIAGKLYISETTVKTILKNAYNKLGVHSKIELNSREF